MAKRKMIDPEIRAQIKAVENKTFEIVPEEQTAKVSFDEWWLVTSKQRKIPSHLKEVVFADFKGRKLTKNETIDRYNEALTLFGY